MAAALLKARAEKQGHAIKIDSAGTAALVGSPPPVPAMELMVKEGFDISGHRAQQLSAALARKYELILVVELAQKRWIEAQWPMLKGRVHRLGKGGTADIVDPYGQPAEVFMESLDQIKEGIEVWSRRLLQ